MSLLFFAVGLLCGWLITLAADVLPRFARTPPAHLRAGWRLPALWRVRRDKAAAQDAVAEIATGLAFAWVAARLPTPQAALVCAVCAYLLLVALIDVRYRLIPNIVVYPAFGLLALGYISIAQGALNGALLGAGFAFFIFYSTARLKPGQLGMGDVKLATLIGFGFGFPGVLLALIVGAGAGAGTAFWLLLRRSKATRTIPYAPFLCLGALAVLFIPFFR
jgi:leader peptidase (prepilin peptidase)/N-methyltransferase